MIGLFIKRHNKKGFTLVELCVALAIAAIVGTMIVTSTVFLTKQNNDIKTDAAFISEVTAVQKAVNDWIKRYDNAEYTFSDGGGGTLSARKGGVSQTVTFSGNELMVDGASSGTDYQNISSVKFTVSAEPRYITVSIQAKKDDGKEWQTLIFPLFAGTTRDRGVTERGGK